MYSRVIIDTYLQEKRVYCYCKDLKGGDYCERKNEIMFYSTRNDAQPFWTRTWDFACEYRSRTVHVVDWSYRYGSRFCDGCDEEKID